MTEYQLYLFSTLLGQVAPAFTDVINKYVPSSTLRFWISIIVSALIGIAVNYDKLGAANIDTILTSALLVWSSGQVAYKNWYGDSKFQSAIRYSAKPLPL
jgi:uncharacterized membrane protein